MQQKVLDFRLYRPYNGFCAMQQSELASEAIQGAKALPDGAGPHPVLITRSGADRLTDDER
jgi:hypothetical protein